MWTELHSLLQQTLTQKQLLIPQERVLMAFSAGQDSLCLLQLLRDLQPKWQWFLAIAHCDHGWRYDQGLAEHVQTLAQDWQLPLYLRTAPDLPETEAAARQWRYATLEAIARAEGFTAIVTAHTQTDLAETFLYNLIRGSGADGLGSLPWQRGLNPQVRLVRPALGISRTQTGDFCQQLGLPIWLDAANQELKFARNRLRLAVFPYLKQHFNPQVEKAFAQSAHLLSAEVDYLESLAREVLVTVLHPTLAQINRDNLRPLHLAVQRRVVRGFLGKFLPKSPNFVEIESVTSLISAPNRTATASLAGGLRAEVSQEWIRLI